MFGTANPLVVEIVEHAHPNFKNHPFISMEDDHESVFSSVPYGVLHIEDIRVYMHCPIKELGSTQMLNLYNNQLVDKSSILKPKFQDLENKGFVKFVRFSMFYEHEWI